MGYLNNFFHVDWDKCIKSLFCSVSLWRKVLCDIVITWFGLLCQICFKAQHSYWGLGAYLKCNTVLYGTNKKFYMYCQVCL